LMRTGAFNFLSKTSIWREDEGPSWGQGLWSHGTVISLYRATASAEEAGGGGDYRAAKHFNYSASN
jgi:hypothetical protein